VFDIGAGEFIVIALVALLIIGPERLPAMAKQWTATLRAIREQAARARTDLQDSVGADVAEVADLIRQADPRRILDGDSRGTTNSDAATVRRSTPAAPDWDPDTP
jgi:sec-independent protein translocase protein TatB